MVSVIDDATMRLHNGSGPITKGIQKAEQKKMDSTNQSASVIVLIVLIVLIVVVVVATLATRVSDAR